MTAKEDIQARYLSGEIDTATYNALRKKTDEEHKSKKLKSLGNASNLFRDKITNPVPQFTSMTNLSLR